MTAGDQRSLRTGFFLGTRRRFVPLLFASIIAFSATPARADFNTSLYTKKTDCETSVDPMTFGFFGTGAWWDKAAVHVQHHTGWDNTGGSTQTSLVHGVCYNMGTQRGSASVVSDRFHIRLFYVHPSSYESYSVGDAHYEEWTWCGHAVVENSSAQGSGFDKGKRRLKNEMNGAHEVFRTYWGNTRTFKQCQGKYAGSNGYVWWAKIN